LKAGVAGGKGANRSRTNRHINYWQSCQTFNPKEARTTWQLESLMKKELISNGQTAEKFPYRAVKFMAITSKRFVGHK